MRVLFLMPDRRFRLCTGSLGEGAMLFVRRTKSRHSLEGAPVFRLRPPTRVTTLEEMKNLKPPPPASGKRQRDCVVYSLEHPFPVTHEPRSPEDLARIMTGHQKTMELNTAIALATKMDHPNTGTNMMLAAGVVVGIIVMAIIAVVQFT